MSTTLSLYIICLVLLNILGCAYFLWETAKQPKHEQDTQTTGHVWDDDLTELNNPLPRWWLILFYLTLAFAVGYLILYPGFGNWSGTLQWNQASAYQKSKEAFAANYSDQYAPYLKQDWSAMIHDPDAMTTAHRLFLANCAACHGSDAQGAPGFPNLTDTDWLYGQDPDAVQISIAKGRQGMMPSFAAILNETDTQHVVNYLLSFTGRAGFKRDSIQQGRELFQQQCSACHGSQAQGNPLLGAPNLTDDIWLYGGSKTALLDSINTGRQGAMPAHEDLLSPAKIRLLSAYVISLNPENITHALKHTSQE